MKSFFKILILSIIFISLSFQDRASIQLPNGLTVQGLPATENVDQFLGIPFAQPPIGKKRFLPAQPLNFDDTSFHGTEIFNANQYGLPCMQPKNPLFQINQTSEDCLYLNIWKPKQIPEAKDNALLPVMVFMYGGGFFMGAGNNYDGAALVQQSQGKAIVITLNYRLGTFGFFASKEVLELYHTTGNSGLSDQRVALQWVQANIKSFGGDPNRVTIFGESAGGESVVIHYINSDQHNLFESALLESGVFAGAESQSLESSYQQSNQLLSHFSCTNLVCLQAVPADQLMQAGMQTRFAPIPTIDGTFLQAPPKQYIPKGLLKHPKPLVVGTNGQELAAEICQMSNGCQMSEKQVMQFTRSQFGDALSNKLWSSVYNMSSFSSPSAALITLLSENGVICPSYNFAQNVSSISKNAVYLYAFLHQWNHYRSASCSCQTEASHTEELIFLWPNWFDYFGGSFTAKEQNLANQMKVYWTNFAESGNPNLPQKPQVEWQTGDRNVILLDLETTSALSTHHFERCAFWAQA